MSIATTASDDDDPAHLPGYDILDVLGQDGFGVFYRARQRSLDRVVVLYTIRGALSEEQYRCVDRGAAVLASLRHPHVIQIYDRLEHAGRPYLVLEFVDGGSLDRRTDRQPQPCRPAAALVEYLARTVAYIHRCGVVHCDLKPRKVLLAAPPTARNEGSPVSAGCEEVYGIPRIGGFELALNRAADPLPRDGTIIGTPAYMAPEQALGRWQEIGPQTDIHGLGAILYELLTGRPPFHGATVVDTIKQVVEKDPDSPDALRPEVDRELAAICRKCLHKSPAQRYAGGDELAADLRAFLDGKPEQMSVRPARKLWPW